MAGNAFQGNAFQSNAFQALSFGSSSVHAYLLGPASLDDQSSSPAYLSGSVHAPNPVHAYLCGNVNDNSSIHSYLIGSTTANTNSSSFVHGAETIDIGPAAINRTSSASSFSRLRTFIDLNVPANHTGMITSISIYVSADMTDVKVGIFYLVSGTTYICRSAVTIGNLDDGLRTINGLELKVVEGDYIGLSITRGSIKNTSTQGSGYVFVDSVDGCVEGAETTLMLNTPSTISIHGIGYSAGYFTKSGSLPAYLSGKSTQVGSTKAFAEGLGYEVNSSVDAFLQGPIAYNVSVNVPCYLFGNPGSTIHAYMSGVAPILNIGPEAIDRGYFYNHQSSVFYTWIDLLKPANYTGILTSVSIYSPGGGSLYNVKIGIYYLLSGTTYKCRSAYTVPTGAFGYDDLRTITGLELNVCKGDFIGITWNLGGFDYDISGGASGMIFSDVCVEGQEFTFNIIDASIISLHGTGVPCGLDGRSQSPVYVKGLSNIITSISVYTEGLGYEANSSAYAFLQGPTTYDTDTSTPSYLCGSTYSTTSGYLDGGYNRDSVHAYINANLYASSFINAYTSSSLALIESSALAYLNGNILLTSSQSAYSMGLKDDVSNFTSAYVSGIVKTNISCYLSGEIVNVDYIWLKTSDDGITKAKKFKVLTESYEELIRTKNENINKTIGGGIDHSVGENSTTWRMVIRVKANESNLDYGNLSDLEYFYSLNNPNASPNNDIIFIDHHQYEYITHIIGTFKKSLMTTVIEGQQALYFCSLEVQKI